MNKNTLEKIELIKKLRNITSLGLAESKNLLERYGYDLDRALQDFKNAPYLKSSEAHILNSQNGIIMTYQHFNFRLGAVIEINCETDFVSRDDQFIKFTKFVINTLVGMSDLLIPNHLYTTEEIHKIIEEEISIKEYFEKIKMKFKENIEISRFIFFKLNNSKSSEVSTLIN